jgi:uncharacterized membrane protein
MAACAKCGATLAEGASFCGSCGTPVTQAGGPPAAPAGGGAATAAASSGGLAPNVAAMLAYLPFVGWIAAIVFLVADPFKKDKFIRFHAFQSIFFAVAMFVFWIVWSILGAILGTLTFGVLGVLMGLLGLLIFLVVIGFLIFLMFKAYSNQKFMIPFIGKLAEQQASK